MSAMILAIDPSLDATGWALVRIEPRIFTYQQARGLLIASGTWESDAKADLMARMIELADQLKGWCIAASTAGVRVVAIERPEVGRTYRQHTQQHRPDLADAGSVIHAALAPMHVVTGALALTAHRQLGETASIEFVKAGVSKKKDRNMILRQLYPELVKSNQDRRDAVWLALSVLTDNRRRWT